MTIEVLTLSSCPNADATVELVTRARADARSRLTVRRIEVRGQRAARRMRFLGSPSIRVDGHDVEPGADEREDFAWACRLYRTSTGMSGLPECSWITAAIAASSEEAR